MAIEDKIKDLLERREKAFLGGGKSVLMPSMPRANLLHANE